MLPPRTPSEPASTRARLTSLDGLRGVAAAVVVLHHVAEIARPALERSHPGAWEAVTRSPLKLAFAGTEAVLVFFALSGLVVALPALRTGFSWRAFAVSRALRLYLPVWGALALAALFIATLPRRVDAASPGSWLVEANATAVGSGLLAEATLLPASYDVVNTLWSLRWEAVFSLLLPAFVALALAVRGRAWGAAVLASATAAVLGRTIDADALAYLAVFLLGTLIAVRLDAVLARARAVSTAGWLVLGVASSAALIASWLLRGVAPAGSVGSSLLWGLAAPGAVGLVVVALGSPAARRALDRPVVQWFGRMSFSLYLVHVPVLASLAFLVGEERWPLVLVVGVPAAIVVAWGFHLAVERPSHRLARSAGRRVGAARAHRPASALDALRRPGG